MNQYKENPKTKGSGIICAIPQKGMCPNKCDDCFFQSGRSFLEPLSESLPNMPDPKNVGHRIVRVNDGNDSNVNRRLVEKETTKYQHKFFNTAIPKNLDKFPGPVVLTVNPAERTDENPYLLKDIPENLMFVRVRVNTWNLDSVVSPVVEHYSHLGTPIVLTFMAYYQNIVKEPFYYTWKKRTLNSYWVMIDERRRFIESMFKHDPNVYSCGWQGTFPCNRCGNCLREYFATMERLAPFKQ